MPALLLVGDEKDILEVMSKGLQHAGYEVDARSDPLDALSNFKAGK